MRRGGRLFLLLGILILIVGALAYFALSPANIANPDLPSQPTPEPLRTIVIARIDIPNNTVITDTESLLTTAEIPETQYAAAPGQYFTSASDLMNKQTLRSIAFKEPVRKADVTDSGLSIQIPTALANQPRLKAIPFQVNNLTGVADQIKPSDFVDVLSSYIVKRTYLRPGVGENNAVVLKEEPFEGQTTKTILQNIQVLQIRKPAPPAEGTATPGGAAPQDSGPPATDANGQPIQGGSGNAGAQDQGSTTNNNNTFQPGSWLLVLAVTDQQAELLKYSLEQGTGITLVLRGRGDTAVETTTGATFDLLVSLYGVPIPQPAAPALLTEAGLTPVATTGAPAAPTAPAAPAASPTVTPTR